MDPIIRKFSEEDHNQQNLYFIVHHLVKLIAGKLKVWKTFYTERNPSFFSVSAPQLSKGASAVFIRNRQVNYAELCIF